MLGTIEEPVPFTDSELRAARIRLMMRRAADALRQFRKEWDRMDRRISETRVEELRRHQKRMDQAELYVLRQERG